AANGSDVHTVLIDGQVVVRDGIAVRVDEEAILAEARVATARVVGHVTPAHRPRWPIT
ncbi:MAG: hypothetical protein QOF81_597, partial [Acidimicrobiaceae bacterium]|nr:hypothetical protein [Acidimicrobiaceae bacterium]